MTTNYTAETGVAIVTKAAPPISISLASFAGYPVSDILIWATLLYTLLLITQKLLEMYRHFLKKP
jgi:hypothetical protein